MLMKTIEELLSTLGAEVTTGVTSGVGTAHPSRAPEFTPIFSGVHVAQSLVFCVIFCSFSFGHNVLSVLFLITTFHYPFGIFKLFLI